MARRRKLKFDFSIRKYLRKDFDELKAKKEYKDFTNDKIYDDLPKQSKIELIIHVISWLSTDNDLRKILDDINNQLDDVFNKYNEAIKSEYKITTDDLKKIYEQYVNITKEYINPLFGRFYFVKDVITFLFNAKEKYQEYKTFLFNNKWHRRLDFKNVWDRHSCKVYSSIAEQSNKYYLGNS